MDEQVFDFVYGATRGGSNFRNPVQHEQEEEEDDDMGNLIADLSSVKVTVEPDGFTTELRELVEFLQTGDGVRMLKDAFRTNMLYKVDTYKILHSDAMVEVEEQLQRLELKLPQLKKVANVKGDDDNWSIFNSLSAPYLEAQDRATIFENVKLRAEERLAGSMGVEAVRGSGDAIFQRRDELVGKLKQLSNFHAQAHVVQKTAVIIMSFIKDPVLFRTKMMNFMLMGSAGTGKSTLAKAMAECFALAGLFVGNRTVEAGRSELVAQYEGQTVARTRQFLLDHLDTGVIFIDEAYAITPWSNGKPEGYGSEAATAMVEFMSRYVGLYCIITAGYEKDMVRYFLGTNEGLSRRFPNKFLLADYSANNLVSIFKKKIVEAQGLGRSFSNSIPESEKYFTPEAWKYLLDIVRVSMTGEHQLVEEADPATKKTYSNVSVFVPRHPFMYEVFKNQAGAMANMADEAVLVIINQVPVSQIVAAKKKNSGVVQRVQIGTMQRSVMRSILVKHILNFALSLSAVYLAALADVEEEMSQSPSPSR